MTIGEFTRALPEVRHFQENPKYHVFQINFREALNAELTNIYKWTEDDMMAIQDFDYFAELSLIIARLDFFKIFLKYISPVSIFVFKLI